MKRFVFSSGDILLLELNIGVNVEAFGGVVFLCDNKLNDLLVVERYVKLLRNFTALEWALWVREAELFGLKFLGFWFNDAG